MSATTHWDRCFGITFLSNHNIAIYHHCFSPSTMASFHRHRFLLLHFEGFLWLLPKGKFNQSLVLLIALEVLIWAIILLLYCCISLSPSPLFFILSYRFIRDPCQIENDVSPYIVTTFMRNVTNFFRSLCLIDNAAWHCLDLSFMINDAISSLPWFIVVFFYRYMFSPCIWVQPLIIITDFIWSTFMRDLTLPVIFFINNYQNRTNIWEVIHLHWIKNIKAWYD